MAIFFTADTHFGDEKIAQFFKRKYDRLEDQTSQFFDYWAEHVKENDTVYHLVMCV